ncbi:MAG: hypothetical protein M1269_07235 [Chloroflexi bacterium]|nr:hypothetical protein [Chloroflexota bacterium]
MNSFSQDYFSYSSLPKGNEGSKMPEFAALPSGGISKLKKALKILDEARARVQSGSPLEERWKQLLKAVPDNLVEEMIERETSPSFKLYPSGSFNELYQKEKEIRKNLLGQFNDLIPSKLEGLTWPDLLKWANDALKKSETQIKKIS